MNHKEYELSVKVARILDASGFLYTHVANERQGGKEGAHAKRMGVQRGVPDYLVFEPHDNFIGLAIELKVDRKEPSEHQLRWHAELSERGWRVLVCRTPESVVEALSQLSSN